MRPIVCLFYRCVTTGDGGDGSSGSEESGNDGGVSTIPVPVNNVQTTYDALRGLGIVGGSPASEDENADMINLPGHARNNLPRLTEVCYYLTNYVFAIGITMCKGL